MGKQCEAIINHFSHPHPLHLTNPHHSSQTTCSACKLQTLKIVVEPIYTCKTPSCTYSLHLKCSQLPYTITHPCHHHHHHHNQPLSLLLKPPQTNAHPNSCNACGKHGDGFLYNCKDCNINIHVMCATLPLHVSHPTHSHQLSLVFFPPYGNNGFSCDVCGVNCGSFCWLYRCISCGFDAHLSCAMSKVHVVPQVINGGGRSMINNGLDENLFLDQFNNQKNQYLQAIMGGIGGSNNVNNQIMQGMLGGGGGGGSNPVLQAMLGGGGGGGGSNPFLQAFMGGGGGGGGGGDLVQSILNGSGGGVGGGLDLSSVLGGGGDLGGLMGAGLGGFGF